MNEEIKIVIDLDPLLESGLPPEEKLFVLAQYNSLREHIFESFLAVKALTIIGSKEEALKTFDESTAKAAEKVTGESKYLGKDFFEKLQKIAKRELLHLLEGRPCIIGTEAHVQTFKEVIEIYAKKRLLILPENAEN